MPNETQPVYYIENKTSGADTKLGTVLFDLFLSCKKDFNELVILCIGSDRITGDSLGPLVGHSLSKTPLKSTYIYGTLAQPVHALNLNKTIGMLKKQHPHSLIIAVDASLGSKNHIGFLTISAGALEPGLGVHKSLPSVGDISITGIVNISGAFDHFLLQSTRLATVVQMADLWRIPLFPAFCLLTISTSVHVYSRPSLFSSCPLNALEASQNLRLCQPLQLLLYQKEEYNLDIHNQGQIPFSQYF